MLFCENMCVSLIYKLDNRFFCQMPGFSGHRLCIQLIVLMLMSIGLPLPASGREPVVSIHVVNVPMEKVFRLIEESTSYRFFYECHLEDIGKKVTLNMDRRPVRKVLEQMFSGTEICYDMHGDKIMLYLRFKQPMHQEPGGKGDDDSGESLLYDILDEVVVIGYGTEKKGNLTGSMSRISGTSLGGRGTYRMDQVLQGRASGVVVSNTSGAPGGSVRMRIRGANSILGDNSPLFVVDGLVGADFSMVNPDDIESIDILKDASAAAIYGSRGANGVIIVTTRTGSRTGKVSVSYNGEAMVSNVLKMYDLMGAGLFAEQVNAHDNAMGESPTFTSEQIAGYYKDGGFDYQKAIFRTAVSHQHQLCVTGGDGKLGFRVSGNYLDMDGVLKNSGYRRFGLMASSMIQANDRLSFRFNINGVRTDNLNNDTVSGSTNVLVQALAWAPTTFPYDDSGAFLKNDPIGSLKSNPLAILYESERRSVNSLVTMTGEASCRLTDGLTLNFLAAGSFANADDSVWKTALASGEDSSASVQARRSRTMQTTTTLSWQRQSGWHEVNAVAALETQRFVYRDIAGSAAGLYFPMQKYHNLMASRDNTSSSSYYMWALMSYIGRINYSFKDRYLASVSIRQDGSSKFSKGRRFGLFPSAAIAWQVGKEKFLKDVRAIDRLKLRASWGLTGSQAVSPYATRPAYDDVTYSFATGTVLNGIRLSGQSDSGLSWETTEQVDLGMDMTLFQGRMDFEADWYMKNTRDLLLNKKIPGYLGGGSVVSNIGRMRNVGVDLTLSGRLINKKNLSFDMALTFSWLKNTVRDLGDETVVYMNSGITGVSDGFYDCVYMVGHSLGSLWGLEYIGPWRKGEEKEAAGYGCVPGDARYVDIDGNGVIDGNDYKIIGCGMPDCTMGLTAELVWKRLAFNVMLEGVFGNDKIDYNRCMFMMAARDARAATFAEAVKRYIPGVQEDAWLPAWSPTSQWKPASTLFLENAGYLRLKNIGVAYDLKIRSRAGFRISANATNLFTLTRYSGIDPESSNSGDGISDLIQGIDYGAYPNCRTFTIGLRVSY